MKIPNRREFFKLAGTATAATAALPAAALAFKAPIVEEPDLPDWWKKVFDVDTVEDAILAHAREIAVLLRESQPDDAYLLGFQFTFKDNEIDTESIWATPQFASHNLANMRPAVYEGWRERPLRIAGNTKRLSEVG